MTGKTVGLLTRNLLDRSRLEGGLAKAGWEMAPLKGPNLPPALNAVLVDLEHPAALAVIAAASAGSVRSLAYGPHVRVEAMERARRAGADQALARSVVFRDPASLAARLAEDGA